MKMLTGRASGIDKIIVGSVAKGASKRRNVRRSVLVVEELTKRMPGYRAIIVSKAVDDKIAMRNKAPIIELHNGWETLNEGDIVLLNTKAGTITVEHEISSGHNSVLLTNRCNCRCIMCPQIDIEDYSESHQICSEIIGLLPKDTQALGITGGEPTLVKTELLKTLLKCRKHIPNTQVQLLTNGILLADNSYVDEIARVGLSDLVFCIPIYSDIDYEHDYIMQKTGAFENALVALYNLAAHELSVEIRTVVLQKNYRRLANISDFIYRNVPFSIHVAFMGIEIEGRAKDNLKELWVSPRAYLPYLQDAVRYLAQRNMQVSIYNEPLCVLDEDVRKYARKSISEWKTVYPAACNKCKEKLYCAGFFASSLEEKKNMARPL